MVERATLHPRHSVRPSVKPSIEQQNGQTVLRQAQHPPQTNDFESTQKSVFVVPQPSHRGTKEKIKETGGFYSVLLRVLLRVL